MIQSIDFWAYIGKWSLYGIFGFSLFLVIAGATRIFHLVRDSEGELRKPMPFSGWALMTGFVFTAFSFSLAAVHFDLIAKGLMPGFWQLFLMNFLVFFAISLFDTFIIDILILVIWHPKFLNLPDSEAFNSATYHIKTLVPATFFSLIFSFFGSLIAWAMYF